MIFNNFYLFIDLKLKSIGFKLIYILVMIISLSGGGVDRC